MSESTIISAAMPCDQTVGDGHDHLPTETGDKPLKSKQSKINETLPNGKIKHGREDNGLIAHLMYPGEPHMNSGEPHEPICQCASENPNTYTGLEAGHCNLVPKLEENDVDDCDESSLCESVRKCGILENSCEETDVLDGISYIVYESERQMPDIMKLITKDLSEPYSIYTYRYFIHNWPKLCFLAMDKEKCVGAIVCKLDMHKKMVRRGYIAMLAIDADYRRRKIGSHLVLKAIRAMISDDCDEVVLETEITNKAALRLYENLGFVRDKRLFRYYLNGVDALRLKLWLR